MRFKATIKNKYNRNILSPDHFIVEKSKKNIFPKNNNYYI